MRSILANSEKLKNNLQNIIDADMNLSLDNGQRKKPKTEMLLSLKDIIITMLFKLYPVSEILAYINHVDAKFSVSDTTLMNFLKEYAYEEYILTQKTRYFCYKINSIDKLKAETNNYEEIFNRLDLSGKINGKTTLDLTLEDFEFFWKNYYVNVLEKEGVNTYAELNYKRHSKPHKFLKDVKINNTSVTPADKKEEQKRIIKQEAAESVTESSAVQNNDVELTEKEINILNKGIEDYPEINEIGLTEKIIPNRNYTEKYTLDFNAWYALSHTPAQSEKAKKVRELVEKPLKEIPYKFELLDGKRFKNTYKPERLGDLMGDRLYEREKRLKLMDVREDIDDIDAVDFKKDYKEQITIHQERNDILNTPLNMMTEFRIDYYTEEPLEKFVYIDDNIDFIQFMNLSTLNFVEGQAIVTQRDDERRGGAGFDLFRYYKGEIYFVEAFDTLTGYSPSIVHYIESNSAMVVTEKLKKLGYKYRDWVNEKYIH